MSSEVHDTEMLISDTDLLGDYLATGDADSFTQIVKRHSALVMGVCKRATGNVHDAEDAFQSTFMVLAKNASKVRKVESLPSWLYGVAFRVAMRLNKVRTRLKTMTDELDVPVRDDPFEELNVQFLHQKTDEAIQRLPDKLRGPIVLRYLMGKSNAEVAESLSVNVSTVEGRLKRAKNRLRMILTRHGVTLGAALIAVNQSQKTIAAEIPSALIETTSANAIEFASSGTATTSVAQTAIEEVFRMSVVQSTKVLVGLFASVILVSSSVVMSRAGNAQDQPAGAPSNGNQLVQSAKDDSDPFADSSTRLTVGNSTDLTQAATNTTSVGNPNNGIGGGESLRPFDNKIRSQSEIAILKALEKSTSVEFRDETLDVFVDYISSQFDVNIHFDSRAITDIGMSADAPIEDVKLKNLTLNEVLSLVLEPMGLGFTIHKSALLITTKEREEQLLETRVYKFDREKFGVEQGDELIEMITTLVQPDSWSETGGAGEIVIVKNGFAVTQSFGIHERIHALLAQLKRNVDTKKS